MLLFFSTLVIKLLLLHKMTWPQLAYLICWQYYFLMNYNSIWSFFSLLFPSSTVDCLSHHCFFGFCFSFLLSTTSRDYHYHHHHHRILCLWWFLMIVVFFIPLLIIKSIDKTTNEFHRYIRKKNDYNRWWWWLSFIEFLSNKKKKILHFVVVNVWKMKNHYHYLYLLWRMTS